MARAIMIQGTGSDVGKSLIVAGLARAFTRRGLRVRPFKPQNMSNNAAVTADGGEIGRAQALQARAAGVAPTSDMNPVLLKPQSEDSAQVILQGQVASVQKAADYGSAKQDLMPFVLDSFLRLSADCDLVLVEGAGSPAETNLRAGDIANMGFACAADVPVVLLGDIDRGGVIAQLVGTKAVLGAADLKQVKIFIINKFRGDIHLFDEGRTEIEKRTDWPCLGVLPWFEDAHKLPAEDAQNLPSLGSAGEKLHIVVPRLPRISNFDDLDPLLLEPDVKVEFISKGAPLPASADVVILPGSKSTMADLAYLRAEGWDIDIAAHLRRGGHVLGICGGFQMLGQRVADPDGVEGTAGAITGLGHLEVETVLAPIKRLGVCEGRHMASGAPVSGYEIHMGHTRGADCTRAWLELAGVPHGATSPNGRVSGCYLHGLFTSDSFRKAWLARFNCVSALDYDNTVDATLDALAEHLEAHLNLDRLLDLSEPVVPA